MDELKKVTAVKNRRSLYVDRDGGRQQDCLWRQVRDGRQYTGPGSQGERSGMGRQIKPRPFCGGGNSGEEIVKCRDCIYITKLHQCSYYREKGFLPCMRPDDFCSHGKRGFPARAALERKCAGHAKNKGAI